MNGWWIVLGTLTAACLALAHSRHRRRGAERARIDRTRMTVEAWLPAVSHLPVFSGSLNLEQPGGSPAPPTGGASRRRHRVVLSDPNLGATLSPGWRLR